jgi:hypothetical protein
MRSGRKLYAVASAALAAEVAAYLAWRPAMLRWGTQASEATEPLPGDYLVPHPRVQRRGPSPSMRLPDRCGRGSCKWVSDGRASTPTTGSSA